MSVLEEAFRRAENSLYEARNSVDHDQRRQFASRQDVIAHREDVRRPLVDDALVDALVAATDENDMVLRGKLARDALGEGSSARVEKCDCRFRAGAAGANRSVDRFRKHDHSGPSSDRLVVDGLAGVVGEVSRVCGPHLNELGRLRALQDGLAEDRVNHLGKKGDYIESDHRNRLVAQPLAKGRIDS